MPDDDALQTAVQKALRDAPGVTSAHVGVTARAGVVTLTGRVDTLAARLAAEAAARHVEGVLGLAEKLVVQDGPGAHPSDEDVAIAAVRRIAGDTSILPGTVQVEVDDGWVTLTGKVDWPYQKRAAEQDVQGLPGTFGVSNELTVAPALTEAHVREAIVLAVHRSGIRDPGAVSVAVDGGQVRLSGTVRSLGDRDTVTAVAWAAPGTVGVENDLAISPKLGRHG